jgi:hypothetical protein
MSFLPSLFQDASHARPSSKAAYHQPTDDNSNAPWPFCLFVWLCTYVPGVSAFPGTIACGQIDCHNRAPIPLTHSNLSLSRRASLDLADSHSTYECTEQRNGVEILQDLSVSSRGYHCDSIGHFPFSHHSQHPSAWLPSICDGPNESFNICERRGPSSCRSVEYNIPYDRV